MNTSENGLNMIKKLEGCRHTAYWDVDAYSIGYGHHSKTIKKGDKITKKDAEQYLIDDIVKFENAVNVYDKKYHFTQYQYDALVSFTYNCGAGNLKNLLKNGTRTPAQISGALPLYNKAGGKVCEALVKRRAVEKQMFDGGV